MVKLGLGETWTRELIEQELDRIHQQLDLHLNQAQPYEGNLVIDLAWCYSAAITLLAGEAIERMAEDQG